MWNNIDLLRNIHANQPISFSSTKEQGIDENYFGQISALARDWTCLEKQDSIISSTKEQVASEEPKQK